MSKALAITVSPSTELVNVTGAYSGENVVLTCTFATTTATAGQVFVLNILDRPNGTVLYSATGTHTDDTTGIFTFTLTAPVTYLTLGPGTFAFNVTRTDSPGRLAEGFMVLNAMTLRYPPGFAAQFNGLNYLSAPSNASLQMNGAFTVSCWLYVTSATTGTPLGKYVLTGNLLEWQLQYTTAGLKFFISPDGGVTFLNRAITSPISLNTWYHVVCTFDGNLSSVIYLNTVNSGTATASRAGVFAGSAPFTMGAWGDGSNGYTGIMASPALWKRVLAAVEITQLYNGGAPLTAQYLTGTLATALVSDYDYTVAGNLGQDDIGSNDAANNGGVAQVAGVVG